MVTNEWKELLRDHLTQTRCCPDCPVTFLPVNARVIDDIVNLEHFKLCLCCSIAKEFPQQQRANCQAGLWSTMWSPQARWDVDLIEVNPAPSLPLPPPRVPDFLGCFGRAVGYFIGCYHCGYHRYLTKLYVAASTVHLCRLCTVRAASQVYTCGEIDPCPPRRSTHRSWARWSRWVRWAGVDFPRVSNLQPAHPFDTLATGMAASGSICIYSLVLSSDDPSQRSTSKHHSHQEKGHFFGIQISTSCATLWEKPKNNF